MLQQPCWLGYYLAGVLYRAQQNSQYCIKIFVVISKKVTWIVTWENLERFAVHVSLKVYALHSMECPFIKGGDRKIFEGHTHSG